MMTGDDLKATGMTLFQAGAYDEAVAKFEEAVTAYVATDDGVGQAEALNNIGVIRRLQGRHEPALVALQQAADIFAASGDQNRQAQALGNMGDLRAAKGERSDAARAYSDAAALFAADGDHDRQSQVLRALSLLQLRQGKFMEAMWRMEESLTARQRLDPFAWLFRGMLRFALRLFGAK